MTNFEKAVWQIFEEWSNQLDKEMAEAEARGEIPIETEEERREKVNKIWELAHKE